MILQPKPLLDQRLLPLHLFLRLHLILPMPHHAIDRQDEREDCHEADHDADFLADRGVDHGELVGGRHGGGLERDGTTWVEFDGGILDGSSGSL
jgi:hypothetical protein